MSRVISPHTNSSSRPIWLIGTHRSGTTLLSILLEKLGCFMGWRKEHNNESIYFIKQNNTILNNCGASWDNPYAFKWLSKNNVLMSKSAEQLHEDFYSYKRFEYWGMRKRLATNNWGWKDPRMSITAPLWLEVFPNPKIIRVIRNGIDVASSLYYREYEHFTTGKIKRKLSYRCLDLHDAFSLWEEYIASEEAWIHNCELDILTIYYEDFLLHPKDHIDRIIQHLGLKARACNIDDIVRDIDPTRSNAFLMNAKLIELYDEMKTSDYMMIHGYDKIT